MHFKKERIREKSKRKRIKEEKERTGKEKKRNREKREKEDTDKGMCMLVSQTPYFLHVIKLTNI